MLIDADLSSLEVRIAAFLSQDPILIHEVNSNIDLHLENAKTFFNKTDDDTRTLCKIISFRMIYGGSAYAFHMDHKMPKLGLRKWEGIVTAFYEKYSGLKQWQDTNYQLVCRQGYLVNPTGRILTFHKQPRNDGTMMYNRSEVCNYPCQSLATADIVPLAMVVIYRRLLKEGLHDVKMINQVHDSIIFDSPPEHINHVCSLVSNVFIELPILIERFFGFPYNVNMKGECKFGDNWNTMEKWKGN